MARNSGARGVDFRLYCVTARRLLKEGGLVRRLAELCEHGLKSLQVREKDLKEDELLELARDVRDVVKPYGVRWLINARAEVVLKSGATGVHLTAEGDIGACRRDLGPGFLIGKSVHGVSEAVAARAAGADFLVFGPVFPASYKADIPGKGLEALEKVCAAAEVPVFAIGGITPERARRCRKAGAHGAAVMSVLMEDRDPKGTLASFEDSLGSL